MIASSWKTMKWGVSRDLNKVGLVKVRFILIPVVNFLKINY